MLKKVVFYGLASWFLAPVCVFAHNADQAVYAVYVNVGVEISLDQYSRVIFNEKDITKKSLKKEFCFTASATGISQDGFVATNCHVLRADDLLRHLLSQAPFLLFPKLRQRIRSVKVDYQLCNYLNYSYRGGYEMIPKNSQAPLIYDNWRVKTDISGKDAIILVEDAAHDTLILKIPADNAPSVRFASGPLELSEPFEIWSFDHKNTRLYYEEAMFVSAMESVLLNGRPEEVKSIICLSGRIFNGNSGGLAVDASGNFAGLVFAAWSKDGFHAAYLIQAEEVKKNLDKARLKHMVIKSICPSCGF